MKTAYQVIDPYGASPDGPRDRDAVRRVQDAPPARAAGDIAGRETACVAIECERDAVDAAARGRALAARLGFGASDQTVIGVAITEVARNMNAHAHGGRLELRCAASHGRQCITVVARDRGPGIADLDEALADGYSTSGAPGLGLPVARRLMDEFAIVSAPGRGTTVMMKRWGGPYRAGHAT